ncbi:MAG: 2-dehydropantoate 2-reductase [Pseudomonas sp.]|nr:2-dehydropantoate 2-reductase [Pseudomonas sp.]
MRFAIVGAGSLGLLWAGRLARAGHSVCLLLRTPQAVEHWRENGSKLLFEHDDHRHVLEIQAQLHTLADAVDCLIVATKAYSVSEALESLNRLLAPGSSVVLLQNGLGSQQQGRDLCAQNRVLYASVTDGAWMPATGHVVWAGKGVTRIGDPSGASCPAWLEALPKTVIDWAWEPDIERVLWQKLAINCAINPYTVLYDCANGDVPARAGSDLNILVEELQAMLRARNFASEAADLPGTVAAVIQRTASNSSSMRQDVHANRRTEIDYILGYACRTASAEGLRVPTMLGLYDALKTHLATLGLPTS